MRKKKSKEQIHSNMSRVKSSGSLIERLLARALWERGLRYRKNVSNVFGKPDIVFLKKKIAVFCDSEFWHGFDWEERKKDIKSHQEFWIPKIERNIKRDQEVNEKLRDEGWIVLRFWGTQIKCDVVACVDEIERAWRRRNGQVRCRRISGM